MSGHALRKAVAQYSTIGATVSAHQGNANSADNALDAEWGRPPARGR